MKICHACGRSLDDQMRFCDGCGAPQAVSPVRTQPPPFVRLQAVRAPNLPKLVVPLALLIVGLIVGVAIGGALFSHPQIQTISQQVTTTSVVVSTIQPQDILEVCYSPRGHCADRVILWINKANSSLHVLTYSFTFDAIGDAILNAKQRNPTLDIKIAWDKSEVNGTGSQHDRLQSAGINIRVDHRYGLLHDKVAIIDGHIILTGSFNWSNAANQYNRENLVILDNPAWAAAYEQQFQLIWAASS